MSTLSKCVGFTKTCDTRITFPALNFLLNQSETKMNVNSVKMRQFHKKNRDTRIILPDQFFIESVRNKNECQPCQNALVSHKKIMTQGSFFPPKKILSTFYFYKVAQLVNFLLAMRKILMSDHCLVPFHYSSVIAEKATLKQTALQNAVPGNARLCLCTRKYLYQILSSLVCTVGTH
jgi:hypothetical protein